MELSKKLFLVVAIVVCVGLGVFASFNSTTLPASPGAKLSTKLEKLPSASKELKKLLHRKTGPKVHIFEWKTALEKRAIKDINGRKWFHDPGAVETYLTSKQAVLDTFLSAMRSPGCYPSDGLLASYENNTYDVRRLDKVIVALRNQAILWAQQGKLQQAAQRMLWLHKRVHEYRHCKLDLLPLRFLTANTIEVLEIGLMYIQSHPKLSVKWHAQILKQLSLWKKQPAYMAQWFRMERFTRKQIFLKLHQNSPRLKEFMIAEATIRWPVYSAQNTVRLSEQMTHCHLWLLKHSNNVFDGTLCPIEAYLKKVTKSSSFAEYFHYNYWGKKMLANFAQFYRRMIEEWQKKRCGSLARKALIIRLMDPEKRKKLPKSLQSPPMHPYTQKPFPFKKGSYPTECSRGAFLRVPSWSSSQKKTR